MEPVVVARAGHRQLMELARVLRGAEIESSIVCPPGANPNH